MKELQAPPLHKNPENSAGDRRAPCQVWARPGRLRPRDLWLCRSDSLLALPAGAPGALASVF